LEGHARRLDLPVRASSALGRRGQRGAQDGAFAGVPPETTRLLPMGALWAHWRVSVSVMDPQRLGELIAAQTGADAVLVNDVRRLSGGAIQESWAADLVLSRGTSRHTLPVVVRCDAPSGVSESRSRAEEFALLSVAFAAG